MILGVTIELFIEAEEIRKLKNHISKLQYENELLMEGKTQIVEIVDNRTKNNEEVYHDYFKPF